MYSRLHLDLKEIRLLRLHPGAWNDAINCSLQTVSLNDRPCYKALSYVWGIPHDKPFITIDHHPLAVTRDLFTGLQRIRDTEETVTLWADAVCINQADIHERSQQVQLMGDIYSFAEEVLIWLGYPGGEQAPDEQPSTYHWTGDDTDMVIVNNYFESCRFQDKHKDDDTYEDLLGAFVFLKLRALGKHWSEIPFFDVEGTKLHARRPWPAALRAIGTLGSNPWWTRVWVFQETVLARTATVFYGHVTAPWDMFAQAAKQSLDHDNYCCEELLVSRSGEEIQVINKIRVVVWNDLELTREFRAQAGRFSLRQLMHATHSREATDVRDKVYGLLGLVTKWEAIDSTMTPIIPDYNLPPSEVFIQATVGHIQAHLSLQELIGTTRTDIPDIPSWITQKSMFRYFVAEEGSRSIRSVLFLAAGDTVANVKRICNVLAVDGFSSVDTIAEVAPSWAGETLDWKANIGVLESWRHMAGLNLEAPYLGTGKQSRTEAFWRTVLNDCRTLLPSEEKSQLLPPNTTGNVLINFVRLGDSDPTPQAEDFWKWFQDTSNVTNSDHIRMFHQSFLGASALRKFFITTGGHMGIGPPDAQSGDEVAILLGGDVPFCIRAIEIEPGKHYKLVGDAYVHGLMDGEGVPVEWQSEVVQILLR